jgi:hypothetical protein
MTTRLNFKEALRDFTIHALKHMHDKFSGNTNVVVAMTKDGPVSIPYDRIDNLRDVDCLHLSFLFFHELINTPYWQTLLNVAAQSGSVLLDRRNPGTINFAPLAEAVRSFLSDIMKKKHSLNFDESIFDSLYPHFEKYVFDDDEEYLFTVPLIGLRGNRNTYELTKEACIELLSEDRSKEVVDSFRLSPLDTIGFGKCIYAITAHISAKKVLPNDSEDDSCFSQAGEIVNCTLISLRIIARGNVIAPYYLSSKSTWHPYPSTAIYRMDLGSHSSLHSYDFADKDYESLIRIYPLVLGVMRSNDKALSLGMRRFAKAIESNDPEDKLIDLMISAEALYLSDMRYEASYRFSQRVALYLSDDASERMRLNEFAKVAYDQRSNLFHGRKPDSKIKLSYKVLDFREFVEHVEEMCRKTLYKMLITQEEDRPTRKKGFWDELVYGSPKDESKPKAKSEPS